MKRYSRVVLLRGGPSAEYEVSMQVGAEMLQILRKLGYEVQDVVITKKGEWLDSGMVRKPEQVFGGTDVVFLALRGTYGEDGTVQRLLERFKVPFTGSNSFASKLAHDKTLTKKLLAAGIAKVPKHHTVSRADIARLNIIVPQLNTMLGEELFVKPVTSGSSLGATYAPTPEKLQLTIEELLKEYESVLVEEYIRGKEATVAVLEKFRGDDLYVFPTVEVVPPAEDPVYSFENKFNGKTREICPGRFSYHEKSKLADAARAVHSALNCDQFSRSDFIIRDGDIYLLEANSLPRLSNAAPFVKAAQEVGLSHAELIKHLIETARF